MISLYQNQIDRLKHRIDQIDKDMEAIATAIKRNNENTQAILDAINEEKERTREPIPIIGEIRGGKS